MLAYVQVHIKGVPDNYPWKIDPCDPPVDSVSCKG